MATKLIKSITRESSETVGDKEILVTLTENQEIELKLKGNRGKGKVINILELYNQLSGVKIDKAPETGSVSVKTGGDKKRGDGKMISLYDLRSHNAISTLDLATVAKFDQIIKSIIDNC